MPSLITSAFNRYFHGSELIYPQALLSFKHDVNVVWQRLEKDRGLIGRTTFTGNYQWLVSGYFSETIHPPEVVNEVQLQSGMRLHCQHNLIWYTDCCCNTCYTTWCYSAWFIIGYHGKYWIHTRCEELNSSFGECSKRTIST